MVRGISKPTLESHKFTPVVIGTPSESGTLKEERNLGMSMETRPNKPVDREKRRRWVTGVSHK
jgi:hypothetical protein